MDSINMRRLLGLAVTLVFLTLVRAGPAAGQGPTREAKESDLDLAMTLKVDSQDGAISACEPLILEIHYRNVGQKDMNIRESGLLTIRVTVLDGSGKVLAETVRPQFPLDVLSAGFSLKPGEARLKDLVISGLYRFKKPGKFAVRVQRLALTPEGRVIAEGQVSFRVLPYDAKRLDARCAELRNFGSRLTAKEGSLAEVRKIELWHLGIKAMYTACGDAALPYLDRMAREYADVHVILAIRRIGTERARKLAKALAARSDNVGEAARKAMSMSLEPSDVYWEMGGY